MLLFIHRQYINISNTGQHIMATQESIMQRINEIKGVLHASRNACLPEQQLNKNQTKLLKRELDLLRTAIH